MPQGKIVIVLALLLLVASVALAYFVYEFEVKTDSDAEAALAATGAAAAGGGCSGPGQDDVESTASEPDAPICDEAHLTDDGKCPINVGGGNGDDADGFGDPDNDPADVPDDPVVPFDGERWCCCGLAVLRL